MNKTRLEAFSDGVIAIIITIMVLELKMPHEATLHGLIDTAPTLLAYVLSFVYIGIYWGNHHHLIHTVKHITPGIIWANLHLLFWLSLIPFATGWMGEHYHEPLPVVCYAILLNVCGIAYTILQVIINRTITEDSPLKLALKKQTHKGFLSVIGYGSAIPFAYVSTYISLALFVVVGIIWLVPDRNIERAFEEERR